MPTGLQRREGGRYSVRRRVPADLVEHYGMPEITRALGTADPKIARKLLPLKWAAMDEEFDASRVEIAANPTAKQPSAPSAAAKAEPKPAVLDRWATMSREEWDHRLEADEFNRERDIREEGEREEREEAERIIRRIVTGPADGLTAEQLAMRDLWRDQADLRQIGEENEAYALGERKRLLKAAQALQATPVTTAPDTVRTSEASEGISLDAIVDKWAAERKVTAKGVDTHRAVARWFVDRVGEGPVREISKKDGLLFKDKLTAEGVTANNIKTKLSRLNTLLNYAVSNDYLDENPIKDVTILVPEAEKSKRKPFDLPSLTAIFSSPVYSEDARPTQGRGEAAYWLPLLGLYTGARLEELGQLRATDIREERYPDEDDVDRLGWFIHVTQDVEDDLKLKNAGSERLIPVHPALVECGFIRLVEAAQRSGQTRLFPLLRPNKYGRLTAKWGEWFGAYKREVVGITDRRLVFHSFRHTFAGKGRGRIDDGVKRQIMGHSSADVADRYGDGHELWQLVQEIRKYKVPGFKLPSPPPDFRSES